MARVREKSKKGHSYFYLVESRRVGPQKQPREVIVEYIGTVKNLMEFATNQYRLAHARGDPDSSSVSFENLSFKCYLHGAVTALYWAAQSIGLEEIMDKVFSPKTVKGLPRSRVLLLAMIHRAVDPGSKRAFAAWSKTTSLPYHLRFDPDDLDSAAFWEAMDGIKEKEIAEVWNQIVKRLLDLYQIDLKNVHLDYTNYFTFIDTRNGRCYICIRGHNKQMRNDLRQFCLAALTSALLKIPIVWQIYEGNRNDKAEFPVFTEHIREQLTKLGIDLAEITIVFDGGSNSEKNFEELGFHFVCSHSLVSHKDLYDIDLSEYQTITLNNGNSRSCYLIENLTFSGVNGRGVLTFSEDLYEGQVAQLNRDRASIMESVKEAQERLHNLRSGFYASLKKMETEMHHAKRDAEEYNQNLDKEEKEALDTGKKVRKKKRKEIPEWDPSVAMLKIVSQMVYKKHGYFQKFTSIELTCNDSGTYDLKWVEDAEALSAYCRKYYGKKLLVTDHTDWSMQEIVNEYSDQECIENDIFRMSKNTDHFSVRPQYHWTDDKILVHLFICLTSIVLAEVLQRQLDEDGIHLSKPAMLDRLNEIHDGWVFVDKKKANRVLEDLDEEHQRIWDSVLKLKK